MNRNTFKGRLTIARRSDGLICMRVEDAASRTEFLEMELTPEVLGNAITSLAYQPVVFRMMGLEHIGKRRVIESRTIVCPLDTYKRDVLEAWLEENGQEEGWLLSSYLGSQSSIRHTDEGTILNYSVVKYVDEALAAEPL